MKPDIFWPSAKHLSARFEVDLTTARRWRREQNAPRAVMMLLAEDLGVFDAAWAGWVIRSGLLISPEGFEATMADVRSLPFMRMQIATYQALHRQLKEAVPQIDEQPTPDSWEIRLEYG